MVSYAFETGGRAQVSAVLRSNYEIVRRQGFSIDSIDHGRDISGWRPTTVLNVVPDARADPTTNRFDYIVVTTKNIPDVSPTVADIVAPAVTPGHSVIVLIQNGINIHRDIGRLFPSNTILSGVQLIGVYETSPGVILHNERDSCKIGVLQGEEAAVSEQQARLFIDLYNACGKVDCQYDADVERTRWYKLVYNASYNSIAALLQLNVTEMRLSEHIIDDLVRPAMDEIVAIAAAAGPHHFPDDTVASLITVDQLASHFVPSMAQDVARGNLIECENIVGEPVRAARDLGVPCPTLTCIYALLRGIQTRTKLRKGLVQFDERDGGKYAS